MYKKVFGLLAALSCIVTAATAQEGHPLTGTWQGSWGAAQIDEHFLTFVMTWDGKKITGISNPGPDSTPLDSIQLDSSSWTVRIDTQIKDSDGQAVHFVGEGQLENVGSSFRTLNGTWRADGASGKFTLARQGGP